VHFTSTDSLATVSANEYYDAALDFSATENPSGVWRYGWSPALGGNFVPDTVQIHSFVNIDDWTGAQDGVNYPLVSHNGTADSVTWGTITMQPGQLTLQAGANGEYSVVRWTAPRAGSLSLKASFTGQDFMGPTSTDVHVRHNSVALFDGQVTAFGAGPSFDTTMVVAAGDTIDFAVGYGSNGSNWRDTTGLDAFISYNDSPITDYTFTPADAGRHTFAARFWTGGLQSLTARDTATPSITGTQTGIQVTEPRISIGDVTLVEGNAGTKSFIFTVSLSDTANERVTVNYATADGTAQAGKDYVATSETLTFDPGQTSKTIAVLVTGDRVPEPDETFFVNLSNPTNGTIADGQSVGTIVDDEPRISINDVTKAEGSSHKTTQFTFTVTLSAAYDQSVTVSFQTLNGTATTSNGDYVASTGSLTFRPGETAKTITIQVTGDSTKEADEYFYLDLLGNSSNSLLSKKRGIGTILNDD
jgi:hypothetical protein